MIEALLIHSTTSNSFYYYDAAVVIHQNFQLRHSLWAERYGKDVAIISVVYVVVKLPVYYANENLAS